MTASNDNVDKAVSIFPPSTRSLGGPQSPVALEICRGATRLFASMSIACVSEFSLPNGRRADIMGLCTDGSIWIVEIKSSVEDFRSDQKWPEYREYCDRLFFAVRPDFPVGLLPEDAGLVLADRYGGEIVRSSPEVRLSGARRRSVTLKFARAAASRLAATLDPSLSAAVALAVAEV